MNAKKILSLAASTIKLFIIILLFNSNSKAEEQNIKSYSDDKGILALMYHRFDEYKYPSTNIKMDVLGSIRSFNTLVENNNSKIIKNSKTIKNKFCLVVPEGSKKEMSILFDFSLECSKAMPECQFIWRLHPLFKFNDKFFKNKKYRNLPNNIIMSDQNLNYDLLRSEWVLYRASSVVIQAIVAGLKPIYLHRANEIKIDPIHKIINWKSEVVSVQEFKSTVIKILGNYSNYEEAKKYCMSIYSPLNATILINIIGKKN